MTIWNILIWGGAGLTVLGLLTLVWCILTVISARRAATDDETLRRVMQRVTAVNMAALAASVLGLMLVVLGIILGR